MKTYKYNNRNAGAACLWHKLLAFFLLIACLSFQEVVAQDKNTTSVETKLGLKKDEFLPEEAWNHRFKFSYLNGKPQEEHQLSEYKGKTLYFFFWDASYPNSYSDLRKLYEICLISSDQFASFVVHSKKSKDTQKQLKAMMDCFEKEYGDVMDTPIIMEDEFFTTLFQPSQLLHYTLILNNGMVHMSEYYKAKL
ncbi:hypothetical protein KO02_21650 [Sphingobacterium sp. ML3W]|uniref:hypothetical protein n=1 Tax=Sphingobacterium sp. ML3W TaxID=1538644 RepID=UPI0004F89F92|nr:hypothetical protein [Sphingobacterium sp. ML3W]AIM39008.1 hypothetical protein KO02_21650 [Sphingobacterium sp. ML3W]